MKRSGFVRLFFALKCKIFVSSSKGALLITLWNEPHRTSVLLGINHKRLLPIQQCCFTFLYGSKRDLEMLKDCIIILISDFFWEVLIKLAPYQDMERKCTEILQLNWRVEWRWMRPQHCCWIRWWAWWGGSWPRWTSIEAASLMRPTAHPVRLIDRFLPRLKDLRCYLLLIIQLDSSSYLQRCETSQMRRAYFWKRIIAMSYTSEP